MGVPASKRVSMDSKYGYYFVPVVGCGRGCGHGFWLAGADLPSLYLRRFYPLPSIPMSLEVDANIRSPPTILAKSLAEVERVKNIKLIPSTP